MQKYTTSTNGLLAGWVGTGTYLTATTSSVSVINTWTIAKGELSELAIQATFSTSTVYPRYLLQEGVLPPGLTLYRDGTIGGRSELGIDPDNTRYRFTATIVDSNNVTIINPGTFDIIVTNTTSTGNNTSLFCKPMLSQQKRREFSDFINNPDIFIPSMIYRKFDPNFGVQKELKLVIFYELIKTLYELYFNGTVGLARANLSLSVGGISSAISKNKYGDITSEIIYLNIIDKHTLNSRVTTPSIIKINGITYNPPSIINIRTILPGGSRVTIRQPNWSKTLQPEESVTLEYAYVIPLCFTLPKKSATILRKIEESGFKFNTIDYDIDRFIIESVLNELGNKYVALPRDLKLA
jgi:hypothetical protein